MLKWTSSFKQSLQRFNASQKWLEDKHYKHYKDGPYVTAEPVVTTYKVPDAQPSFLILATDGLWDKMTSEQAVSLVGRWVDLQSNNKTLKQSELKTQDFGTATLDGKGYTFKEDSATIQDDNAAVHLMRNALGGANEELIRGALTIQDPRSRSIRDDITVQVVFFAPKDGAT
jgi:pyruvate dehydrogenase phosphatase